MIHHRVLPEELTPRAAEIFDAAFGSKLSSFMSKKETRAKLYRAIFRKTPIVYIEENGDLMGLLIPSTSTSPKMLTFKEVISTLGLIKGILPALQLLIMQHRAAVGSVSIEFLAVDSKLRGRGIGTQLFEYIENWAVTNGYSSLTLEVVDTNLNAKKLYQRLGFIDIKSTNLGLMSRLSGWDFKCVFSMKKELTVR